LGIDPEKFGKMDIHVHVPAGAVPKDGPSAGVAMATALTSLLLNQPVRSDVAMTGEITLRGLVLPVGGIKEKILAARQAGITTVILPRRNERNLVDLPPDARSAMTFVLAENIDDVLRKALTAATPPGEQAGQTGVLIAAEASETGEQQAQPREQQARPPGRPGRSVPRREPGGKRTAPDGGAIQQV
jgi:ATP-dependent Lon protease